MDGHTGSDRLFSSIEDNVKEIIRYIDENHGGSVLMIEGLFSWRSGSPGRYYHGGKISAVMLIVESAMAIPSKINHAMVKPAFSSRFWFDKTQMVLQASV